MTTTTATTAFDAELTAEQLATLREALEQCKEERVRLLAAVEADALDSGDQVAAASTEGIRDTLRDIEAAFGRMEAGTYGRCGRCSGPIPYERMLLVPFADTCVACK